MIILTMMRALQKGVSVCVMIILMYQKRRLNTSLSQYVHLLLVFILSCIISPE